MSDSNNKKFQLSQNILAHESDVRAVCVVSDSMIASASRDKTVKLWVLKDKQFEVKATFTGHQHFVNSLAYMKDAGEHYPNGVILSGSMDKTICVWNVDAEGTVSEPDYQLVGHSDCVCTLGVLDQVVVSGSWDKSVKVWKDWTCVETLKGHEQAVWCVKFTSDGNILTACADKQIRLFKLGKCIKTFSGHSDVVRSLTIPLNQKVLRYFYSASNDCSLKKWDFVSGVDEKELHGHNAFVYGVDSFEDGTVVSCGEDKSARVWQNDANVQTIIHPTQSVWCIATLANGDFITGGNDGFLRIFTRSEARVAAADVLQQYDAAVSKSTVHSNQVGDVDKSKLPGPERLHQVGKKDGEVVMVKQSNGAVEAHQWSNAQNQWTKIGDVVDAVGSGGSGRKQMYNGKEYDFVFDVDVGAGMPTLKLPYNTVDNPYNAAQQFISDNELSQDFLEQVAQFIMQNAKTQVIGQESSAPVSSDPYHSARYVPGAANQQLQDQQINKNFDPYTGAQSGQSVLSPVQKILPLASDGYLKFEGGNLAAIQKKIDEFDSALKIATPSDKKVIQRIAIYCTNPHAASADIQASDIKVLSELIEKFPQEQRFPLIDLLRLVISHTDLPLTQSGIDLFEYLIVKGELQNVASGKDANQIVALRALSNMLAISDKARIQLIPRRVEYLQQLPSGLCMKGNKNVATAYVTLLLNWSIAMTYHVKDAEFALQLLQILVQFLQYCKDNKSGVDNESIYRAIVAIGQILYKYGRDLKEALSALAVHQVLGAFNSIPEQRMHSIIKELCDIENRIK
ncbi:hypothetical protein MIR68_008202 [Amoeboaphelidium protococcarum]|nr:hypothetical protein MIR68_008202 [Amoeboaphelidium protococcarum]